MVAVLAACSGSPTDSGPLAAVRIVSGAGAADTIGAYLSSALYVEVTDAAGERAAGVEVRFTSPPLAAPAHCSGSCAAEPGIAVAASRVTGADGRAYVPLRLGLVAGDARVVVAVPALGAQETAGYTVLPGQATRVTLAPRDTVVYLGAAVRLRGAVVDRAGNARPEAPTLVGTTGAPTTGLTVTASAYGVHQVQAQSGTLPPATATVAAVPRGTIAALAGYGPGTDGVVVVFDLDGTQRARLTLASGALGGFTWSPDGSRIVFSKYEKSDGPGYRLYATTLAGTPAPLLPARTAPDEEQPAFSRDGRWLFFGEKNLAEGFSWQIWRARADGSAPTRVGGVVRDGSGPVTPFGPSPDGGRAVYGRGSCCPTATVMGVVDVASGAVSEHGVPASGPRWSPAGDRIAYATPTGPATVSPDGTGTRTYPEPYNGFVDLTPDWSPDGRWLITKSAGPLVLVDVESGARIPLPYFPGAYHPRWKP